MTAFEYIDLRLMGKKMSKVEYKTILQAFKRISHIKTFFVLKFCIFVCDLVFFKNLVPTGLENLREAFTYLLKLT